MQDLEALKNQLQKKARDFSKQKSREKTSEFKQPLQKQASKVKVPKQVTPLFGILRQEKNQDLQPAKVEENEF